jgi:hypothetical protein|tara:strand:- start:419 stop:751 length:333 start_codon:yes stop_codon:yes gene_type:complete
MTAKSNIQSPGQKLHLLRLNVGWSEQECAYRLTLEANELITTALWISWERSGVNDTQAQHIYRLVEPICKLFSADKNWLLDVDTPATQSAKILTLQKNKKSERKNPPKSR